MLVLFWRELFFFVFFWEGGVMKKLHFPQIEKQFLNLPKYYRRLYLFVWMFE